MKKYLKDLLITRKSFLIFLIAFGFYFLLEEFSIYQKLPSFKQTMEAYHPSDVLVLDRDGFPLNQMRTSHQQRSLDWLKTSEIASPLRTLLIQTEDKRFYQHMGVDFLALANSFFQTLTHANRRGGSTLSMQLVRLLNPKQFKLHNFKSKYLQILQALMLDLKWTKEEILEAYINLVPIRGEILGLKAASFTFFNKAPLALNTDEAALLIALLRSPNAEIDLVANRVCKIIPERQCLNLQNFTRQTLQNPTQITRDRTHLPIFSKKIVESQSAGTINTSLDVRIQDLALSALREQLVDLKNRNVKDGAVLILDSQTGKVLAYVGNAGPPWTELYHIDGIDSARQLGSTIKPFLYATAFDLNIFELNSLVEDSKADIPIEGGVVYHPQNYDHSFRGLVSAGEALGSSLNVPAVRTLLLVGQTQVMTKLRQLGFSSLKSDEFYGPSLALGTVDASLWELTHAYRNLAQSSIFSDSTRSAIFSALAAPEYRRFTFGLDSTLNLPFAAAVKTGTSKDMRDNWCIGWTDRFTIGVWVGNFNGEPMWNVSGMTGAAPIWHKLMLALHTNYKDNTITLSTQLNTQDNSKPQVNSIINQGFLKAQTPLPQKTLSHIRYPVKNMLVAFDQDIPAESQKIAIEIENPQNGQLLYLNNKLLTRATESYFWSLKRGRYNLALKSKTSEVIDQVQFEVR